MHRVTGCVQNDTSGARGRVQLFLKSILAFLLQRPFVKTTPSQVCAAEGRDSRLKCAMANPQIKSVHHLSARSDWLTPQNRQVSVSQALFIAFPDIPWPISSESSSMRAAVHLHSLKGSPGYCRWPFSYTFWSSMYLNSTILRSEGLAHGVYCGWLYRFQWLLFSLSSPATFFHRSAWEGC